MFVKPDAKACSDCARAVVCGNTLVCGLQGERCEQARCIWSNTSCGEDARFFLLPGLAPRISLRAEAALVLRAIAFRIFSGRGRREAA